MKNNVTAIIEVKVKPEAEFGYNSVARIIAEFKEVESVYLTSGGNDLIVIVNCPDTRVVSRFVSSKLSTIKGVEGTTTNFIMERYKQSGEILYEEEDERELGII